MCLCGRYGVCVCVCVRQLPFRVKHSWANTSHSFMSSFLSVCHLYNARISWSLLMVWLVDFLSLSCHTTPPPSVSGSQIYRNSVCIRVCSSVSVCVGWGVMRSPFGAQSRQNKFCQQSLLGKHDGFWLGFCDKFHLPVCCDTHTHTHGPIQTAGVLVTHTEAFLPKHFLCLLPLSHIFFPWPTHIRSYFPRHTHTHTHTHTQLSVWSFW